VNAWLILALLLGAVLPLLVISTVVVLLLTRLNGSGSQALATVWQSARTLALGAVAAFAVSALVVGLVLALQLVLER
jgi:hypothetical protein